MSRKKKSYEIKDLQGKAESIKLNNGNDFTAAMVGAYYGSSLEYNVSIHLQLANGGCVECPAQKQLQESLRPKYADGEFGALKSETQDVKDSNKEIGRCLVELASTEDIESVRQSIDRSMILNSLTDQLKYVDKTGKTITYTQLMWKRHERMETNRKIQAEKDEFILKHNLGPRLNEHGRLRKPEYPEFVLRELQRLNNGVWTATGVNLIITFTGLHTIAKDGNFVTGKLNQEQLDQLASLYRYKETNSFYKGTLKSATLSVPIQTLDHLAKAKIWLKNVGAAVNNDWPESVKKSLMTLVKVDTKTN